MENVPPKLSVKNLAFSGKILASALSLSKSLLLPGAVPAEIDKKIENFIISFNAVPAFKGYSGYPCSTCISINHQIVHGIPTHIPLKCGDLVTIDIGVSYNKNHTDAARTFVVGNEKSEIQTKLIHTANKALDDGIRKAVDKNNIGDISYAIQRIIEFNSFKTPLELGGHGIGLVPHGSPFIPNYGVAGSGPGLESGMCLAIEPIVVAGPKEVEVENDGWTIFSPSKSLSAHAEDTVVVTDGAPIILTRETLEGEAI